MNVADQLKNNIMESTKLKIELIQKGLLTPESLKQCLEKRDDIEHVLAGEPRDIIHVTTTSNYYPIYEDYAKQNKLLEDIKNKCNDTIAQMLGLDIKTISKMLDYCGIIKLKQDKYLFTVFI